MPTATAYVYPDGYLNNVNMGGCSTAFWNCIDDGIYNSSKGGPHDASEIATTCGWCMVTLATPIMEGRTSSDFEITFRVDCDGGTPISDAWVIAYIHSDGATTDYTFGYIPTFGAGVHNVTDPTPATLEKTADELTSMYVKIFMSDSLLNTTAMTEFELAVHYTPPGGPTGVQTVNKVLRTGLDSVCKVPLDDISSINKKT